MSDGEGKGPGYALVSGLAALSFLALIAWAGIAGAIPWWGAVGADGGLVAGFVWLMVRADWG